MPASPQQQEETRERRKQAVALRLAGATFQQIADQLGYADRQSAAKDIERALDISAAQLNQSVEQLRAEEDARLMRLLMAVWPAAMRGDVRSAEAALKISESRRRLHRTDRPEQIEVITVDAIDREIAQLRARFPQLALPGGAGPVIEADAVEGVADGGA